MAANNDTAALARLRERAGGLGLKVHDVAGDHFSFWNGATWVASVPIRHLDNATYPMFHVAHALLDGLSMVRGPVVGIRHCNGKCPENCDFWRQSLDEYTYCAKGWHIKDAYYGTLPGPGCPKPAPPGKQWVLCLVDEEVE